VFGKFAQAEREDGLKEGSGLGLNIVSKIAAQHGGTVGFEDAPSGGTKFYFEIPLWQADVAETPAEPRAELSAAA
jgi:signal transduction histidine kinase